MRWRRKSPASRLFAQPSIQEISKLRVTGLCEGNLPVTSEFPAQRASNAENIAIWWRHAGYAADDDDIQLKRGHFYGPVNILCAKLKGIFYNPDVASKLFFFSFYGSKQWNLSSKSFDDICSGRKLWGGFSICHIMHIDIWYMYNVWTYMK